MAGQGRHALWFEVVQEGHKNTTAYVSMGSDNNVFDLKEAVKVKFAPRLDNVAAPDLEVYLSAQAYQGGQCLLEDLSVGTIPQEGGTTRERRLIVVAPSAQPRSKTPPSRSTVSVSDSTRFHPSSHHTVTLT
jgi:hypothetical protein